MKKLILVLTIFLLLASSNLNENQKFLLFLETEWKYELSQNPVYATAMGVKGYETKWKDNSLKGIEQRKTHNQNTLKKVNRFDPSKLSKTNNLNLRLFIQLLENKIKISEYNRHLLPFSHRGGIQLTHEDTETLPLKTLEDYSFWIERLNNLDKRINQLIS